MAVNETLPGKPKRVVGLKSAVLVSIVVALVAFIGGTRFND